MSKNVISFRLIFLWCGSLSSQDPLYLNFQWFNDHNVIIVEKTGNCGCAQTDFVLFEKLGLWYLPTVLRHSARCYG